MEQDILEMVISELLDEQKAGNHKIEALSGKIAILSSQVRGFESLLTLVKVEVPPIDTFHIETLLLNQNESAQKELNEIKRFILSERKKKEFWNQIYQWLPWLIVLILCSVIFRIMGVKY